MKKSQNSFTMKQLLSTITLSALAITGILSCTKSSSSSNNNTSPYVMSATKNGSNVSFSGQSYVVAFSVGPLLEIEGYSVSGSDTSEFLLMVGNYTGPASYTIDGTTNVGEYVTKSGATANVSLATSGNITITSATAPTMKGTFNFSGTGITITNGSFTA